MARTVTLGTRLLGAATIALAMTLSGCGHPVQRQLEGRWYGDSVERFATEYVAPATAWVKGTSFEFAGSELTVIVPPEDARSGEYSVSSVNSRDVHLLVERKDGSKDPMHIKLDGEHSIRWMLDDSRAVVLKREL